MNEQEQNIYNAIKATGESGISAETLSEQLNIPKRIIEDTLKNLYNQGLLNKTKTDMAKKVKGIGRVLYGALIYTVSNE